MKNQYFGDKRDYFKYAVLELLMRRHPGFRQLTCVWMLTPNYANTDGNKPFRVLPGRETLANFLSDCRGRGARDIRELRQYFNAVGIRYLPYRDDPQDLLSTVNRSTYFAAVPSAALTDSLVFFDPDNGLAPAGGAKPAHVRPEELRSVFERMNSGSATVVYQHLPRVAAAVFWPRVARTMAAILTTPVAAIAEADVALLVAAKRPADFDALVQTLEIHQMVATEAGHKVTVHRQESWS